MINGRPAHDSPALRWNVFGTLEAPPCRLGKFCMSARTFIDTNILIYGHDLDAGESIESPRMSSVDCGRIEAEFSARRSCRSSTSNATRKLTKPLTRSAPRAVVETYALWSVA